jgi:hypothetical protein
MKNILTCDEWYELGTEMGDICNKWEKIYYDVNSLFGQSHQFTKLIQNIFSTQLTQLKSDLDDAVHHAFPFLTNKLPGYDVKLSSVFYGLNRNADVDFSRPTHKKYPKKINRDQYREICQYIEETKTYLNKVNDMLHSDKFIGQFSRTLNKIKYMMDTKI